MNFNHLAKHWNTICEYGILASMKKTRKYTLELDEALVQSAVKASGRSFTETVRQGLKLVSSADVYARLLEARGTVDLKLDVKKMRRDKRDLR
jgi:hypothetical protein